MRMGEMLIRGLLSETLKSLMLIFSFLLYVLFVVPIKALAQILRPSYDGIFIIAPGSRGVVVQPQARKHIFQLALAWGASAGLRLTSQGHLLKKTPPTSPRGYVLSLAVSLKNYLESKGYRVRVKLKDVMGEELIAVMEIKKESLPAKIVEYAEALRPSRRKNPLITETS
ncbi:MAG: hypothetical protein ACP5IE_09425 [Infirmifilum sp.]